MFVRLRTPLLAALYAGCGSARLPDPHVRASAWSEAAARGDSAALYAQLDSASQRELGEAGVQELVRESRREIADHARATAAPSARAEVAAAVRWPDGDEATLAYEEDTFKVSSSGLVDTAAATPAAALAALRDALRRQSYPALLRVLGSEQRGAAEGNLADLIEGLADPATLDLRVNGDGAEVRLPGGHRVLLRRERGAWRVRSFE